MAKYYNNQKKTGKVAGSVFAIRYGETIERAYNPVVANPNTPAQVEARAKLKLMSQLAAVMAPVVAIPRVGARSSRNLFVKKNYPLASYNNNAASVPLTSIQLTNGVLSMKSVYANFAESALSLSLAPSPQATFSRVVYAVFLRTTDEKLRYEGAAVASTPGEQNVFFASVPVESASATYLVLAYGLRDNTEAARVTFGNLTAPTAETVARLIMTRTLLDSDVTLSETRGYLANPA